MKRVISTRGLRGFELGLRENSGIVCKRNQHAVLLCRFIQKRYLFRQTIAKSSQYKN